MASRCHLLAQMAHVLCYACPSHTRVATSHTRSPPRPKQKVSQYGDVAGDHVGKLMGAFFMAASGAGGGGPCRG